MKDKNIIDKNHYEADAFDQSFKAKNSWYNCHGFFNCLGYIIYFNNIYII